MQMNEPANEMAAPGARLAQADQALLLARIMTSVVAFACFAAGEGAVLSLARFQAMFAELGKDAELPGVTTMMISGRPALLAGLPLLFLATLFFTWSRGKAAAWMAGGGLLLMILCAPLASWAGILPLMKIIEEMGNM
jgi:hypothetical protein